MKRQMPATAVVGIALLIVAAVAYWLVIKPKRAEASSLDTQIASLQTQIGSASHSTPPPVTIKVADLFRLAKAMPDQEDMSGIVIQLNAIAAEAGVSFVAIEPQPSSAGSSYQVVPVTVRFDGSYYDLVDFLFRLRNLVTVKNGVLDASGRLLNLEGLKLSAGSGGFPQVEAELNLAAYVYGTVPLGSTASTTTDTTATDTTQTDTTATDTTSSGSAPQAAGVTP